VTDSQALCRVLSLDGGGAKGFYTLGALKEIEGLTGRKLCETFGLVFGTSTGAIIAALVGVGYPYPASLRMKALTARRSAVASTV
jgi:patatin-like phospholipase/acyl hydrolase